MTYLLDSHYHFDFIRNDELRRDFLEAITAENIGIVAQTVIPSSFISLMRNLEAANYSQDICPRASLGFHPWYIQSQEQVEQELELFQQALIETRYIGEIGLDFAPRRLEQANHELQLKVFTRIIDLICQRAKSSHENQPFILSIHAVRSVTEVLDVLCEHNLADLDIIPILHRFAGTSDELTRHIKMGGYLSVHPKMLETKRGRAYLQQIPADRILLESDLPENHIDIDQSKPRKNTVDNLVRALNLALKDTLAQLSELRQEDMAAVICRTQAALYHQA